MYFFSIFLLTSAIALATEYCVPEVEHKIFWQNVAIGIWCSNLLVLVLELINYLTSKSELLHRYLNEAQKLQNKLLSVREKSGEKDVDLAKVIVNLNDMLDFTHLFDIYLSFSFLNSTGKNRYKHTIESIEKTLHGYHQNLAEFSQIYRLTPSQPEEERVLQKYMTFDEKAFNMLRKDLSLLKEML